MSFATSKFCKRDFKISVEIELGDTILSETFANAVYRAKPSRLDNLLDIEVIHLPESAVHQAVQLVCDRGIRKLTVQTADPSATPKPPKSGLVGGGTVLATTAYMSFEYLTGSVIDQWTEMSRSADEADDLMVDVIKIGFLKKVVTNCVWSDDPAKPSIFLVGGKDLNPASSKP